MAIGTTIFGLETLPQKNPNYDVSNKYSNTYFRVFGNGYDSSGQSVWQEHVKAAYDNEVRSIFMSHGWIVTETTNNASSARATKGRSNLYLHPQNFSGVCENMERERLFESLKNASTFKCRVVDVYEEIYDMTDEQLAELLERKRDVITSDLLEEFTTKRRNLYITDIGLFGVNGKIAKKHSVKRLAIDGKKSSSGKDDCTVGICLKFVSSIFDELVNNGKIVTAKTKNDLGYRTAKKGDPSMKNSSDGNSTVERLQYAIKQLKKHNIEFSVKNEKSGHLHCRRKSDDKLVQFWAGTGKIMDCENRGIHNLIKLLTECA
jgi:predicted transcriptional regulator